MDILNIIKYVQRYFDLKKIGIALLSCIVCFAILLSILSLPTTRIISLFIVDKFTKTNINTDFFFELPFVILFVLLFLIIYFLFDRFFGWAHYFICWFSWTLFKYPNQKLAFEMTKEKHYKKEFLIKKFDFQGLLCDRSKEKEPYLYLTNSPVGLITKKRFGDCEVTFNAIILNSGFGIILKANNLENFVMLNVGINNYNRLATTPFIRKNGFLDIQLVNFERVKQGYKEQKLNPSKENKENKEWFEIKNFVSVDNNITTNQKLFFKIIIRDKFIEFSVRDSNETGNEIISLTTFILPTNFPFLPKTSDSSVKSWKAIETPSLISSKIFYPRFGKIGFRLSHPNEEAKIYNLKVEKINAKS